MYPGNHYAFTECIAYMASAGYFEHHTRRNCGDNVSYSILNHELIITFNYLDSDCKTTIYF
ncbi:hypothetical protein BN130_2262 [Cronobacter malonaticus 507]|nr:hypothetical protein BN130_2262 [Cronobacter malonaticus 507]